MFFRVSGFTTRNWPIPVSVPGVGGYATIIDVASRNLPNASGRGWPRTSYQFTTRRLVHGSSSSSRRYQSPRSFSPPAVSEVCKPVDDVAAIRSGGRRRRGAQEVNAHCSATWWRRVFSSLGKTIGECYRDRLIMPYVADHTVGLQIAFQSSVRRKTGRPAGPPRPAITRRPD